MISVTELKSLLIPRLCTEVCMHRKLSFSVGFFEKGKKVCMIIKPKITSVSKLGQNLYKFQNSRTIIERNDLLVNFFYKIRLTSTNISQSPNPRYSSF